MLKRHPRTPAHLFIDNTPYFITASIYQKRPLLQTNEIKEFLLQTIKNCFAEKGWQLQHWVILNNHYHLLAISNKGEDLSKIISKTHMLSAQLIHQKTKAEKPIWWNYWDYCIRDEKDYFIRLNYLWHNPIKHGYVTNLNDYSYSSFPQTLEQQGRDSLIQQFKEFTEYKTLLLSDDD